MRNGDRMRLMRFICGDCGLEMVLPERPEQCVSCGSRRITRKGWRSRIKSNPSQRSEEECETG